MTGGTIQLKNKLFNKKRILIGAGILAVLLVAAGTVYAAKTWNNITSNQMALFNQTEEPTSSPEPTDTPEETLASATAEVTASPTPTPNSYEALASQADTSIMKDTLNVLLIGVDYATERDNNTKEYVNKNFNSDVMMVLAINFKENKVNMISVPRDSYAKIANIEGIYKLNFALEAGGGMTDAGFMNVCKSVQGVLGGVPVNYYMAVTMPVMKELTDAIGGVDFNVDIAFTIDGRSYKKGTQHLDGQGVLDYCRVRKGEISARPGDLNRVNRQKKILLAVFKKLQKESTILDVPKILTGMSGKVFTNMNFAQLASLAVFGSKLPTDNITMRTMPGSYVNVFNRGYVLIDTAKRAALIKEVYGVTVTPMYRYTQTFAKFQWSYMQGKAWVSAIQKILAKDEKLGDKQKITDANGLTELEASVSATQTLLATYKGRYYSSKGSATQAQYKELDSQVQSMKKLAVSIFKAAGYSPSWSVPIYTKGQLVMRE